MTAETLDTFITDVASLVSSIDDEHQITSLVAERLSALLASGYQLPPEVTRPSNERHVTYPLYIAPDESWSLACVVWNTGQRTPVHSHETWGVAGIYSGVERELRYLKPSATESGTRRTWRETGPSRAAPPTMLTPAATKRIDRSGTAW